MFYRMVSSVVALGVLVLCSCTGNLAGHNRRLKPFAASSTTKHICLFTDDAFYGGPASAAEAQAARRPRFRVTTRAGAATPFTIDMGYVPPGGRVTHVFDVVTCGDGSSGLCFETSCHCVQIVCRQSVRTRDNETTHTCVVTADFSDDSQYRGNLLVLVKALEGGDELVFSANLLIDIGRSLPRGTLVRAASPQTYTSKGRHGD